MSSDKIEQLVKAFMNLPGIGPRQAERFVFYLLQHPNIISELNRSLSGLSGAISQCDQCFRYFPTKPAPQKQCDICISRAEKSETLLIVEKDVDLITIEKSGVYRGLYFVLGGLIPILEKEPEKKVRLRELSTRINQLKKLGLKEIILALSASPVGDHTAEYLQEMLLTAGNENTLTISMLGRGLSTGTEIEYSDADTLASAMERRTSRIIK